ncbi:MAG: glycosyltransferase family 4 protein [Candidatus Reddybacter sp.]
MAQNILIVSSRANTGGGGEHYILNIVKRIDRKRYNPFVAIPGDGTLKAALEKLNVEVVQFDSYDYSLAPDKQWYKALSGIENNLHILTDFIHKNHIKLVHTNSNIRWEGVLAANLAEVHHIYAIRIDFDPDHYLYKRFKLSLPNFACIMSTLSTFVLSVSQNCTNSLCPPIPKNKIRTINNGIDQEHYDTLLNNESHSIRMELGIPLDSTLIIAAGRIVHDKGFDIYTDMAIEVTTAQPTVHFVIAGGHEDTQLYESLLNKISRSVARDNFHFLGHRNDIKKILVTADIFVLSSRHEGQSNALLEAMACQCAVIATRCSGVEDAIINLDSGVIIDVDDLPAMTTAITSLLDNPDELERYAASARQRITTNFKIQDKVKELMQLYDDALALPLPPKGSPIVRLFLNATNEIAMLGMKNIEFERRLQRVEHLADLIQFNFIIRCIRKIRNFLVNLNIASKPDKNKNN